MATPLLEGTTSANEAPALLVASGSTVIETVRPSVTDCVAYAWRNADHERSSCLLELPDDFVHDYRSQLDEAAISLLAPVLTTVWAEYGYQVEFANEPEDEQYRRPRQPADKTFWAVWDEAASRLDVDQVVKTADLVDVRAKYTDTED